MRVRDWYFQGWERQTDESGKTRFVYTGEHYSFPGGIAPVRRRTACLGAALTALYLPVALLPSEGGMWRYAAIPQLLEIIPLIYLLMGVVCFMRAKEPLTFRDYYASWRRVKIAAYWSAGFTVLMALTELCYFFVAENVYLPGEALFFLGELGCAALSILLAVYIKSHPATPSAEREEKK